MNNTANRDLRIDFFRGVALLVIFWDHVLHVFPTVPVYFRITPGFWGFSDAAELFVYLSGYVCGIVYEKTLREHGFWMCQAKAGHRFLQIYFAQILTLVFALGLVTLLHNRFGAPLYDLQAFLDNPSRVTVLTLTLRSAPYGLRILTLYMVLLLALPFTLVLLRRSPVLATMVSLGLYVGAQLFPWLNFSGTGAANGRWVFNPAGWQLLFFIGVAFGTRSNHGGSALPKSRWLLGLACAGLLVVPTILLLGYLSKHGWNSLNENAAHLVESVQSRTRPGHGLGGKQHLEPVRLIHFLLLACLGARLFRPQAPFWSGRLARPLVVCGQHSLEVFCFSVLLMYIAWSAFDILHGGAGLALALALGGGTVMCGGGMVIAWRSSQPWRSRTIQEPQLRDGT